MKVLGIAIIVVTFLVLWNLVDSAQVWDEFHTDDDAWDEALKEEINGSK